MSKKEINENTRGVQAKSPSEIPLKGWKDILLRVKDQLSKDNVQIISAGVAFYFFLAMFPTISAFISIYGLITEASQIESQMASVLSALPTEAADTVKGIIADVLEKSDSTLGWSLLLSVALSLYSAKKGISTLFEGLNIAYDETERRGFIRKTAITLLFTAGFIFTGIICLFIIIGLPTWASTLDSQLIAVTITWARWPFLLVIILLGLSLLYKLAPYRDNPEFKWVSWGTVLATVLWLIGSWLFSFYIENYAGYSETYGNLASVVILMLWFFLSAYIILLGAEINSEMEHQTAQDTTTGTDKPMGQRGAFHADHVAADKESENK